MGLLQFGAEAEQVKSFQSLERQPGGSGGLQCEVWANTCRLCVQVVWPRAGAALTQGG